MAAGIGPGLRFACVLNSKGGCRDLEAWHQVSSWRPEDGVLWVHLERDTPEAARWLQADGDIDPLVAEALLADDSRPRVEALDEALLLVLRGVNFAEREELELVPIHIWMDDKRVITLRDRDHALTALREIRLPLRLGRGPRAGGGLLIRIADKIGRDLEPVIDEMEEEVERLEDTIMSTASEELRRDLADVRRRAIHLKRYLSPQREALNALRIEDTPLLDEHDRLRLNGVIDRVSRHIEDLDAIRDRTTILHEDLAALISEKIAKTTHRFTVLAALLLPPSLIAAILGTNIGGIPGSNDPGAFLELIGIIAALLVIQYFILKKIKWL